MTVANAEKERFEAQKALVELQERIQPRHLTADQRKRLVERLKSLPNGQLEIRSPVGNPEARDFAVELMAAFESGGWQVSLNDRVIIFPTPVGIQLWINTDQEVAAGRTITDQVPDPALFVIDAFKVASLPLESHFNRDTPKTDLWLIVGFKP